MALIDDPGIATLIRKVFGWDRVEELRAYRAERHREAEQMINQGFNSPRIPDASSWDDDSLPSDAFPEGW